MVNMDFEYLKPKSEFRIGAIKNIAVPSNNKDDIKKMYSGFKKNESNADMLSQSFGTMPEITPISSEVDNNQNINTNIQISQIPVSQNSNLEKEPVSLDTNIGMTSSFMNNEVVDNNQTLETPINVTMPSNNGLLNETQVSTPVLESEFKVSNSPNIFDVPSSITPTLEPEKTQMVTEPVQVMPIDSFKNNNDKPNYNYDIKDDVINTEIAILESDIKHYEGLVENCRKKIELLKKQVKTDVKEESLENTASNLFSSNGVLDEEQVLGSTPMPTLRAA